MSQPPVANPASPPPAWHPDEPAAPASPPPRPPAFARIFRPQSVLMLSGLLIFAGCFLVNGSAHEIKDELAPVLALLGLFTLYEACVLFAAAWLARHLDGPVGNPAVALLATLAVLLMVDLTFVYNELAIAHLPLGVAAAGFAVVTGLIKAGLVARIARFRLDPADLVAVGAGLAGVFGLPLMLRAVSGTTGRWTPGLDVAAWWVVAAVVGVAAFVASRPAEADADSADTATPRHPLRHLLILLPAFSTLAHLLGAHWVYHQTLTPAHAAPLLLVLSAVLLLRAAPGGFARSAGAAAGLTAVFAAMTDPQVFSGDPESWTALSGWRALLLAAGVLYAAVFALRPNLGTLTTSVLGFAGAALGATPLQPVVRVVDAGDTTLTAVRGATPTSPLQWGFILIAGAFVTLAVGVVWAATPGRNPTRPSQGPRRTRHRHPTPRRDGVGAAVQRCPPRSP